MTDRSRGNDKQEARELDMLPDLILALPRLLMLRSVN
jgi:hypothetical protein